MHVVHVPNRQRQNIVQSIGSAQPIKKTTRRKSDSLGWGDSRKGPSTQVELSFSARNLSNRDWTSKSDPVCIVYRASNLVKGRVKELARTETIKDNLSPNWTRRIKIDYYFESKQPLIFKIYDIDFENGALNDQDFLGSAKCDLADIVAAPNGYLTLKLSGGDFVRGDIIIHAQEIDHGQRETLCFSIRVQNLRKRSIFSNPNVYLEFYRFLDDGTRHLAHRTSTKDNSISASWDNLEIPLQNLCNCDKNFEFLVECYDHSYDGKTAHFMGSIRTTINQLIESRKTQYTLIKQKKRSYTTTAKEVEKERGQVLFESSQLRLDYTFLDYIAGGLQLEFGVCIDFTASNGQPHSITSLHYIDSPIPNQYEIAIRSVLDICQHYNHTKTFEATGFGAKIPPSYEVSHMFPLNLERQTRHFNGIDGVLQAYKTAVTSIILYGPTHFGPSIIEFMHKAQKMPVDGTHYQILLIITDGAITDMKRTKDLIIRASELPISIIIIGVGTDSYDKMDQLDSDATTLEQNGKKAKRDIVQFVPFREFIPKSGQFSSEAEYQETMRLLSKEVLAEVPEQVTSYMRMKGLKPRPFDPFNRITESGPQPTAPLEEETWSDAQAVHPINQHIEDISNATAPPYPLEGNVSMYQESGNQRRRLPSIPGLRLHQMLITEKDRVDSHTIIKAHNTEFLNEHLMAKSMFNIEFVFDCHRERVESLAEIQKDFFAYFYEYPKYRHLRLCTTPPGECSICDKVYVDTVQKIIKNEVDLEEPLKPFTDFDDVDKTSAQLRFRSSGIGKSSLTGSFPRRRNDNWFSLRPCHEFYLHGTCKYGDTCRFNHNPATFSYGHR